METRLGRLGYNGELRIPSEAQGLVIFVDESRERLSSRNAIIAGALERAGMATLRFDLLPETDEPEDPNRADIDRLTERLLQATDWARAERTLARLPIGYFAASIGAAVTLKAAAVRPIAVRAVVACGGRPDLAGADIANVRAPLLIIVGARDETILELNRKAYAQLASAKVFEVVPGASHLFDEPGALERVAVLAANWFRSHLHVFSSAELDGLARQEHHPMHTRPRTK